MTGSEPTVPRELVVQLAASIHELHAVRLQQHATMAQMIRGCIAKIREDAGTCYAARRAVTSLERSHAIREHKREQALALLHLEWLATHLENETRTLDLGGHEPILVAQ